MATMQEIIKKITIQASQTGVEQTSASLLNLARSQNENIVVQERATKSTLSLDSAVKKLQLSLDAEFRAQQKLESVQRILTAARNQGLVSMERENELLTMATAKYAEAGKAAELMGESVKVGKELAMGLVAGLGTGAAFAGLAELPGKIIDAVHEMAAIGHVAETIGITTKALQELESAGAQFHISTETMDSALEKFSKNLGVAATGSGELAKILKLNHVTITGDVTRDMLAYADLVKNAATQEDRNVLTTTAFGKSAEEMGGVFDELGKKMSEADEAGAVHTAAQIAQSQALDAAMVKTKIQMDATFKDFAVTTAPLVIGALGGITAAVKTLASTTVNWDLINQQGATFGGRFGQFKPNTRPPAPPIPSSAYPGDLSRGGIATPIAYPGDLSLGSSNTTKMPNADAEAAAKAAAAAAAAAAKAQAAAIKSVTDSLHLQLTALHETDLQRQIDLELSQAKVSASSREGIEIKNLTTTIYDQKKALDAANQSEAFFAQTVETAFEGLISGGQSFTDVLTNITKALEQAVIQAALLGTGPLAGLMGTAPSSAGGTGGILGDIFSALFHGGSSASAGAELGGTGSSYAIGGIPPGGLSAWSNSIVTSPTPFHFASGAGLMGEAGPEAIMPLRRGPDGRLGVAAANSNDGLTVNVQIIRQPGSGEDRATVTRNGNKLDVKAFIKDTAAEGAAQPGGSLNRAIRLGLGGKQTLTGRGQ